jgi:hypothetical protein
MSTYSHEYLRDALHSGRPARSSAHPVKGRDVHQAGATLGGQHDGILHFNPVSINRAPVSSASMPEKQILKLTPGSKWSLSAGVIVTLSYNWGTPPAKKIVISARNET